MNFIKKIFDGKIDNFVHLQFQRFGKGEFKDRALINAKQKNGIFKINVSYEFANDLVRIVAEKLKDKKTRVKGAIISTKEIEDIPFKEKKQFQGVKRYIIDCDMSGNEILKIMEKFPKAFFALSFDADKTSLKIKPKAPLSGKPGKEDDQEKKVDFCNITTNDKTIGESFVFEKPNFNEAEISHVFLISELIYPKNESDFAKIREIAKRKGKIIRTAKIDGKVYNKSIDFEA
ncbi:MAG: hypothetical protein KatS3mg001_256 [Candidatus Pacearchaeota archaeon]|nr:MAG: hypothetical protein KatS3mg001_256 [Candidatus Pacearchaeota archaeon]